MIAFEIPFDGNNIDDVDAFKLSSTNQARAITLIFPIKSGFYIIALKTVHILLKQTLISMVISFDTKNVLFRREFNLGVVGYFDRKS